MKHIKITLEKICHRIPFDFEPNGIKFGSQSKGNYLHDCIPFYLINKPKINQTFGYP